MEDSTKNALKIGVGTAVGAYFVHNTNQVLKAQGIIRGVFEQLAPFVIVLCLVAIAITWGSAINTAEETYKGASSFCAGVSDPASLKEPCSVLWPN